MNASRTVSVPVGTTYFSLVGLPLPVTINLLPGSGGTLSVDASITPTVNDSAALAASANWIGSGFGAVSSSTQVRITGNALALRFIAATAAATAEVC